MSQCYEENNVIRTRGPRVFCNSAVTRRSSNDVCILRNIGIGVSSAT
jgi:hypothetical protein